MGRIVLLFLFQFARRVLQGFSAPSRQDATQAYDPDRLSKTAIALIAGLAFYILGGLGYYVKVHCWDELTDAQKGVVVQAMIANDQAL